MSGGVKNKTSKGRFSTTTTSVVARSKDFVLCTKCFKKVATFNTLGDYQS